MNWHKNRLHLHRNIRHLATSRWIAALLTLLLISLNTPALADKCLYVSSYHQGYEWNDGIERGIDSVLKGKCDVDKFYMDTKSNKSKAFAQKMALAAKAHIESTKPDVVIACDDNASKYLVMPYYKDAALPIVFCGINWTVEPYGYPYSNVTGMIEISPIKPLLKEVKNTVNNVKHGIYLGPDVISQQKEFQLNRGIYEKEGIKITPIFVKTMAEWEAGYKRAQVADFVIIGNNGGINDWDDERAHRWALKNARTFTVTNYDWMIRYAMLSMTKVAEEQGEWAAKVALSVLGGRKPDDIPIIVNRRSNIFYNPALMEKTSFKLPTQLMHKAIKVGE